VSLLEKIQTPEDLRHLDPQLLPQVCEEVRAEVLRVVSEKGGHLASNLGTVELAVALHYSFESPKDRLVWDVGHQAYPHKILTGRLDAFSSIRQAGGLSGFTCRSESPYDHFGAGHASTSISAALGIAEGLRHSGSEHLAIAIIGDGALTGGLAFEAMNNAGHIPAKNLVVVFNDNEMSIDPNVGALASFVNQTVTHPGYNRFRKEMRMFLQMMTDHGVPITGIASKLRKSIKTFFTPGMLFECFGFRYFGPINGHDVDALCEAFSFIKNEGGQGGPYLVHALTVKGKGYPLAEQLPLTYHGVNPFKLETGLAASSKKKANYQDVFADTLIQLAAVDPRVVAITAAMPSGTGVNKFQKEYPKRCYDVGIAEGHAVLFAAGLATEGYRPVAAIYSTFLQRAFDQIIHDVALQNLPVVFALDRAGLVGADGATHQGAYDLSYLRSVPGFVVMAPKDEDELRHMLYTAVQYTDGPTAIRYPRGEVVGVALSEELKAIPIGKSEFLSSTSDTPDVVLVGVGYAVQSSTAAQKLLADAGVSSALVNARFVKPLDEKMLLHWAQRCRLVVTVEENTCLGGFGSGVMEMLQEQACLTPVLSIGIPDRFIEHGTQSEQRHSVQLDGPGITAQVLRRLEKLRIDTTPLRHRSVTASETDFVTLQ
jgi:1-deoxy-D-xylulose-5-phosphate synthase